MALLHPIHPALPGPGRCIGQSEAIGLTTSDVPQEQLSRRSEGVASRVRAPHTAIGTGIGPFIAAVGLAPGVLRGVALFDSGIAPAAADARGFLSDAGVALILVALIAGLYSVVRNFAIRAMAMAALLVWVIGHAANLEHVLTLGTVVNVAHAGYVFDGTFFAGSALELRHPSLIAIVALVSIGLLWRATSRAVDSRAAAQVGLFGLALIAFRIVLPDASNATTWRQTSYLIENARWISSPAARVAREDRIPGLYPGDLDGSSIRPLDHRGENVLLVVLEGVSGAYLDRIAEIHGLTGERPRLESLDALARLGYTLVNFVNHQRQTNRGLYSLLCGDLPKLATAAPKMTELGLHSIDANCLPQALRRNGYETVFLQAAPLAFMSKDKFAPRAGFARAHGTEWFDRASDRGAWGVDDREFFRQSMRMVEQLEQADRPWFLTLLTSGTHHPFMVPESFEGGGEPESFTRAIDYLDLALGEFLAALEASGIREDTLVVFTSDESFGLERSDGDLSDDDLMLSQAWGVLVALLPERDRREVDTPFMQTDFAISILDYLGLQHEAQGFRGRSFFRSYATARPIPFANTYLRMTGLLEDHSRLLLCREDRSSCHRYSLEHPPLIFAGRRALDGEGDLDSRDDAGTDLLADIASRSLSIAALPVDIGDRDATWTLIETPTTVVLDSEQIESRALEIGAERAAEGGPPLLRENILVPVFGHQYLTLEAGHEAIVELELAVLGSDDVTVRHTMQAVPSRLMPTAEDYRNAAEEQPELLGLADSTLGMRPRFIDRTTSLAFTERTIRPGEPFRLLYSYSADETFDRLNVQLLARNAEEGIAGLVVRKAKLEIRVLEPGKEPTGLVILDYSHRKVGPRTLASAPASQ